MNTFISCFNCIKSSSLKKAYCEIYTSDNTNIVSIQTGITYTQLCPTVATLGSVKNTSYDLTACTVTIEMDGLYEVSFTASSKINKNNTALRTAIFLNDVEQSNIHSKRVFQNATEESTIHIKGLLRLVEGDVLDVRVRHDYASDLELTTEYSNFICSRIDD